MDGQSIQRLTVGDGAADDAFQFRYPGPDDGYLRTLRERYGLAAVVEASRDDLARVRALRSWVHRRWTHDGWNEPAASDPVGMLEEAERGASFRCVEYSMVLAAALCAVGVPARFLNLLTRDAETREAGAGHVVTEAYLRDRRRWVMADGQCDVTPLVGGEPVNAVELQRAMEVDRQGLGVEATSEVTAGEYLEWIEPYLCFFMVPFDNRFGVAGPADPPGRLMLAPDGLAPPRTFQRRWPLDDVTVTRSPVEFYAAPVIG